MYFFKTKSKLVCQHLLTSGVQLVQQHAKAHSGSGNRASVSERHLRSALQEMILYEGLQQYKEPCKIKKRRALSHREIWEHRQLGSVFEQGHRVMDTQALIEFNVLH